MDMLTNYSLIRSCDKIEIFLQICGHLKGGFFYFPYCKWPILTYRKNSLLGPPWSRPISPLNFTYKLQVGSNLCLMARKALFMMHLLEMIISWVLSSTICLLEFFKASSRDSSFSSVDLKQIHFHNTLSNQGNILVWQKRIAFSTGEVNIECKFNHTQY